MGAGADGVGGLESQLTPEQYAEYVQAYYEQWYAQFATDSSSSSISGTGASAGGHSGCGVSAATGSTGGLVGTSSESSPSGDLALSDFLRETADGDKLGEGEAGTEGTAVEEWEPFVDPDTGATYYFNAATGESSWGAPPGQESDAQESEVGEQLVAAQEV